MIYVSYMKKKKTHTVYYIIIAETSSLIVNSVFLPRRCIL